jgi:hypothetical protein
MLLSAPTPAAFVATHLEDKQAKADLADGVEGAWLSIVELLADDARALRQVAERLVGGGTPPKAAANYLVGWFGGLLAGAVGYTHATTGAGLVSDATVRWRLNPGGWPDRVDVSRLRVVVPPDHPWAGVTGVDRADLDAVRRRAVDALVATLAPVVDVARSIGTVGRASLWAEVADGLGTATAGCPELAGSPSTVAPLEALLRVPGVPWRVRPRLWRATSRCGDLVVGQKGGCCLAYLNLGLDDADVDADVDPDSDYGIFLSRFPHVPGDPAYCSTCRFRASEEVEARQVLWAELAATRAATSDHDERR